MGSGTFLVLHPALWYWWDLIYSISLGLAREVVQKHSWLSGLEKCMCHMWG